MLPRNERRGAEICSDLSLTRRRLHSSWLTEIRLLSSDSSAEAHFHPKLTLRYVPWHSGETIPAGGRASRAPQHHAVKYGGIVQRCCGKHERVPDRVLERQAIEYVKEDSDRVEQAAQADQHQRLRVQ